MWPLGAGAGRGTGGTCDTGWRRVEEPRVVVGEVLGVVLGGGAQPVHPVLPLLRIDSWEVGMVFIEVLNYLSHQTGNGTNRRHEMFYIILYKAFIIWDLCTRVTIKTCDSMASIAVRLERYL